MLLRLEAEILGIDSFLQCKIEGFKRAKFLKLGLLSILSAVDEVTVEVAVGNAVGAGAAVAEDAVEGTSVVRVETAGFAIVHVSFEPKGPKWVAMAEVRAVAKDRVALTILGLLKSNFAVERPSSSFLVLIASEHVTLGLEGVAVPKSLVFGKFLSIFDRFCRTTIFC